MSSMFVSFPFFFFKLRIFVLEYMVYLYVLVVYETSLAYFHAHFCFYLLVFL